MEHIAAMALVGIIVPPSMFLISQLALGTSVADAHVTMLNLARSHIESVKEQPFQDLPASYSTSTPVETGYIVSIAGSAVKTYTYPTPSATTTFTGKIQLITVEVSCPDCSPPIDAITIKDYKARR